MKFLFINGVNLNMTGKREKGIYGNRTLEQINAEIAAHFKDDECVFFQSNCEGEIIDKIHHLGYDEPECKGIIINPGAYAHYSYAIADAIASIRIPVVEVHISNISAREDFRRKSVTAPSCKAMISGCGMEGYALALSFLESL